MAIFFVCPAHDRSYWTKVEAQTAARATEAAIRDEFVKGIRPARIYLCIHCPPDRRKCRTHLMVARSSGLPFGQWMAVGDVIPNLTLAADLPAEARMQQSPLTSGFSAALPEASEDPWGQVEDSGDL